MEPLRQAAAESTGKSERVAAAETAWAEAVAPLGLGPRTAFAELLQACGKRRAVIDALGRSEIASETRAGLARQHIAWAERIAACLGVEVAPLESLLAAADLRTNVVQKAEQAATKHRGVLEAARRAVPDKMETLEEANAAMDRWRERWVGLLERLRRPPDESPVAVAAALDGIAGLEKHHREAVSLAERIRGMEADLGRFATTVGALASEVGQEARANAAETARALIDRATAAAAAEAACGQALQHTRSAADAEEKARLELRDVQGTLDAVVASCGAADAEGAEMRIAASRAHADQVGRRDAARAKLLEHGDGLAAHALRSEADAVPIDEMSSRHRAAEDAAASAQAQAEDASVALNAAMTELDLGAASTEALETRADHEAAVAAFDRLLEDQLVLHLAGTMLEDAVREVEDTMGGSALARTSQTFSAVTDDTYTLERHDGPTGEELYALGRAFPNERKTLAELSEGTRDQLYLALRMEALRGHCQSAMAVPFIADDILQTFDDNRAAAALRALCELSADLQVIVLKHHPHLQAIAGTLSPGSVELLEL